MAHKRIKRQLILLFAILADAYGGMTRTAVYRRLWWRGYKPPSIYATVSRMVRLREISREVQANGEVVLRLSTRGGGLMDDVIPMRKLQRSKWDGKWRQVIFDIPERNRRLRNRLREKLRGLGFGMWQESVYVTPHDVAPQMNEYLNESGLFPAVVCFESQRTGYGDDRTFANVIFGSEKLNASYQKIARKAEWLRHWVKHKPIAKHVLEQRFFHLSMQYTNLILSDPFLPLELLPKPWQADTARQSMRLLERIIPM